MAAAGVVVPLLLLLYFLKLRRLMLRIPTTLLWRESTQDLQVNVPFQRLRPSLLLFLQLLLLAALLAALAQPVLQTEAPPSARVILLIDRSASMNATDAEGKTRLEAARAAAEQIARRLGRGDEPNQMMVVAFASTAQVITGFESDRRVLSEAIASITPTDEEANLGAALELAGAFASREDAALDQPPTVVLISDGGSARRAIHPDSRCHPASCVSFASVPRLINRCRTSASSRSALAVTTRTPPGFWCSRGWPMPGRNQSRRF